MYKFIVNIELSLETNLTPIQLKSELSKKINEGMQLNHPKVISVNVDDE